MEGFKQIIKSRTIWGAGVAIISSLVSLIFKVDIDAATQGQIIELGLNASALGGGALAVYGRIKATKKIGR